jgi:hypothetical protein
MFVAAADIPLLFLFNEVDEAVPAEQERASSRGTVLDLYLPRAIFVGPVAIVEQCSELSPDVGSPVGEEPRDVDLEPIPVSILEQPSDVAAAGVVRVQDVDAR